MQKITAKQLDKLIKKSAPKRTALGDGIYLTITKSGSTSFGFRYKFNKKSYLIGLGSFCPTNNTLLIVRNKAIKLKALLIDGINPAEHRKQKKIENKKKLESDQISKSKDKMIFKDVALEYIESRKIEWKSKKHLQQWRNTLLTYAFPVVGDIPIRNIDTEHVLQILKPLWNTKTETATRLRTRIEAVLNYAEARQWRTGANPARWRGHLSTILPTPGKIKKTQHHPALPYSDLPHFLTRLAEVDGVGARALEFAILTAARTSEVIYARWDEFHIGKYTWIIPRVRMKMGKTHRVPISDPARNIINQMKRQNRQSEYVFTNPSNGERLSTAVMAAVLKRMGRSDITVHGFRSTFRDYVAEKTNTPAQTAEAALAHKLLDSTEAAYQRSDLLEKRRHLMDVWGNFCYPPESNVFKFKKKMNYDGTI